MSPAETCQSRCSGRPDIATPVFTYQRQILVREILLTTCARSVAFGKIRGEEIQGPVCVLLLEIVVL
jgi:hypothetical protein